jgi:hypothetical protein
MPLTVMFDTWKLKRGIERIQRSYAKQREELKKQNAPKDKLDQLEASADFTIQENEQQIDWIVSTRLSHEATTSLDVEIPPPSDKDMWKTYLLSATCKQCLGPSM